MEELHPFARAINDKVVLGHEVEQLAVLAEEIRERALQLLARTIEHILPDVFAVMAPHDVPARQVQPQELAPERGRQVAGGDSRPSRAYISQMKETRAVAATPKCAVPSTLDSAANPGSFSPMPQNERGLNGPTSSEAE